MRFFTVFLFVWIFFLVLLDSYVMFQDYGIFGDACFHKEYMKFILSKPTVNCTITAVEYPYPMVKVDYPDLFHYLFAPILFIFGENITFLIILPAFFLLIPFLIYKIIRLFSNNVLLGEIGIMLFASITPFIHEFSYGTTSYTRWFAILFLMLAIFLISLAVKKRKFWILILAVLPLGLTPFVHRVPVSLDYIGSNIIVYMRYAFVFLPLLGTFLIRKLEEEKIEKIWIICVTVLFMFFRTTRYI